MTTARWINEIPVSLVSADTLVFTQEEISLIKVLESMQGHPNIAGDMYPHVVRWQGTNYLEDGHHRVAVAMLRGEISVSARVLDLDA